MRKLLYLLLPAVMALVSYHPKQVINVKLDLAANKTKNINFEAQQMFLEYVLHKDTELCMSGNMTFLMAIHVWSLEHRGKIADLLYLHPNETIKFNRFFGPNWELVTLKGLNLTFRALHNRTVGTIKMFRCVKETYVAFEDKPENTTLKPFVSWDSTIHVPFIVSYDNPFSAYVDFSMILPKLKYFHGYDEQASTFCLNATAKGPIDIFVKRCKKDDPVKYAVRSADRRLLVQGWSSGLNLFSKCPIGEETLSNHLHLDIYSSKHVGVGELIFYNCHNQWLSGKNDDDIRIFPMLDFPENFQWKIQYSVLPFRLDTYFLPMKHMLDTAFVFEGKLIVFFGGIYPQSVAFSACYKSPRVISRNVTRSKTVLISHAELRLMSLIAGDLNCEEEKTYGIYVHIGTGEQDVNGTLFMKYDKKDLVHTPLGPRLEQDNSAVAFNLKKGQEISRNVNWQNLIEQATFNKHMELHMNFNATAPVQLSVSRCTYTPRLKLFPAAAKDSLQFSEKEIAYLHALDSDMSCYSDQNPFRIDYRPKPNFGLTLHVKALEDTYGYVVPYEYLRAELKYRQVDEDYSMKSKPIFNVTEEHLITNSTPIVLPMDLLHLVIRSQQTPPATLRFYMKCSEQCKFAFTRCPKATISEWKEVVPLENKDYVWYTFDDEGVDYLKALLESTNCIRKREPHLYVHIQSEKQCKVAISFDVFKGVDENPVVEEDVPIGTIAVISVAAILIFTGVLAFIHIYRRRFADFEDMDGEEEEMEMEDR